MQGLLLGFFRLLLRIPLCLIFYGTPLLGFWLASSLAAYLGGPHYLPWVAGLLLFPVIPGFWELYSWTHRRKDAKAFLTPVDRISLRTFVLGLVFLSGLLYLYPQAAFVSLSTRGDWMLDNVKDPRAETARRYLFAAAEGLEWLYRATRKNPYKDQIDPKAQQLAAEAAKDLSLQQEKETAEQDEKKDKQSDLIAEQDEKKDLVAVQPDEKEPSQADEQIPTVQDAKSSDQDEEQVSQQDTKKEPQDTEKAVVAQFDAATSNSGNKWPWKNYGTLHPAVANMPAEAEKSIKSVAKYIAKQEKDPVLRIKALHDYVADRIAYDADAFYSGNIPDQNAEIVFKKKKSVCSGYANLLAALGEAINEKIVVVGGDARDYVNGDKLTGSGHAWNAACIQKKWWLIDACWDSGNVSREKGFSKEYRTSYLLIPAEIMIQNHFPDEPTWQLLAKPLSQGEFLRQPMLEPGFQAADLTLVSPKRVRNEAHARAVVVLNNPDKQWLMAGLESNGKEFGYGSEPTNSKTVRFEMPLPDTGTYRLNMFVNKTRLGPFSYVGAVDFVNR